MTPGNLQNDEKEPLLKGNNEDEGYGAGSSSGDSQDSLKDEKETTEKEGTFTDLFRYATCCDNLLYIFGALFACVQGAGWPVISIVFGDMTNTFINPCNGTNCTNMTPADLNEIFTEQMNKYTMYYIYIACAVLVACYFQIMCMVTACERQTHKLRKKFFESILRQNIAFFDKHQSGELTTRLANDLDRVREGIGDKLSLAVQSLATFVSGFAIGFWKCWQMTLVMMSLTPLLALAAAFVGKFMSDFAKKETEKYAKAGSIATEVFSCIKTVVSFRGQNKEIERYTERVKESQKLGIRKIMVSAIGFGLTYFIMYASYALAYWYGSTLVADGIIDSGTVFTVFFCVMMGSFALGGIAPNLNFLTTAKGAAAKIFEIINREPEIDASSPDGERKDYVKGNIDLLNISFRYPNRPEVQVLSNLTLSVKAGETVALVGSSGCGKSTSVNLIQRFYDPLGGQVLLDGEDIRKFNIKWLRDQIGVVSQEPILFGCSIAENISYGRLGITQSQIETASIAANAHDFISRLPKGYETLVGERGAQLSGGQKQRVAIARALVRNPKILLLDEATSALDSESERVVQEALDKASEGRTTIMIAHRLSTIKNADLIYVIDEGVVVETGRHDDLMDKQGNYYKLVTLQKLSDAEDGEQEAQGSVIGDADKTYQRQASVKRSVSVKSKDGKDEVEEEEVREVGYCEILALNKPETCYIIIGCFASLVLGASMPMFAIVFSELVKVFGEPKDEMMKQSLFWSMMFLVIGGGSGLAQFFMQAMLGISGEKLTTRLRQKTFTKYVQQDISYFDDPHHSTGALTTRLATDAPLVQSATGFRIGFVLQALCSLLAGVGIALYYGWQLALALVGCTPVMVIAGYLEMKVVAGNQKRDSDMLEQAGKTASEAIENMRTVQSLTRERLFYNNYCNYLKKPHRESLKQAQIYGLSFAFSQSVIFFLYAGAFRFGAYLVTEGLMEGFAVFRVFFAIAFSGMAAGQISSYLPDYSKAKHAASLILKVFNSYPMIDSFSPLGNILSEYSGSVTFKDVVFSYASRQDVKVLKGLSMTVSPGQTVALVGPSGAGKSTVISLLQRFYDPDSGHVLLDDVNIKDLNVNWLRSQISVVSQEPVLFDCSIRDNMAYGIEGTVSDHDIMEVAKTANIHDFIVSLPAGYDTVVGEKGTQLSGGQKQRVAIARALLCNPRILLLDEATSALDTESEKSVQNALDRAREGRSCIVIAHRLSTIQNADNIVVIENGVMVEQGTHQQLVAKKGAYFTLTAGQRFTAPE